MDGKIMKLKLLLFILLLPLSIHAANTNVFERVLIKSNFQFTGGTPGSGKVLTADAAGNTSWVTPGSGSLLIGQTSLGLSETWLGTTWANLGTLSSNSTVSVGIQAGRNSTFGGGSIFIGNAAGNNTTFASNSIIIGRLAGAGSANAAHSIIIGDNAGVNDTVDNRVTGSTILIGRDTFTAGFKNSIALGAGGTNTAGGQFLVGASYTNMALRGLLYNLPSAQASGALQNDGSGNLTWTAAGSGAAAVTNANNFFTSSSQNTFNAPTIMSNLTVIATTTNASSVFTATTAQFGFNSSFVETHVGLTQTYPNGFNYNAGVITFPVDLTGVTSNNVPLVVGGTGGISTISSGTNLLLNLNINSGAGIFNTQARYTTSTNSSSGPVVMNLIYTNNTIQRLRITTGVVMPTAVGSQNTVEFWAMGAGETNKNIIMTYAGVNGSATQTFGGTLQPGDLFMWTNTVSTPGASSLNNAYTRAVYE